MKLILGSKSPRRKELLEAMGLVFEIRTKETDESFPCDLPLEDVAVYVANKKAFAFSPLITDGEVILCADTVVIVENNILGKPKDIQEALKMLQLLSGRDHKVITGVCLRSTTKEHVFSVCTHVTFSKLNTETINYYVDTFKPFDKAGAYGIQDWIGHVAVEKITGSYNNVVGLPTHETYLALRQFENGHHLTYKRDME